MRRRRRRDWEYVGAAGAERKSNGAAGATKMKKGGAEGAEKVTSGALKTNNVGTKCAQNTHEIKTKKMYRLNGHFWRRLEKSLPDRLNGQWPFRWGGG